VTVPRGGSRREAAAFIERNRRWIDRERRRVREQHAPLEWGHGSQLMLAGELVTVRVGGSSELTVLTYGDRVVLLREGEAVRSAIERDLRALARLTLVPRLGELASAHDLTIGSISIRNQRSRWGSCAPNGNITLNFRLVQMPPAIRDYVLVHELMHIRQQNHSRRFWRLVEAVCPSFREAERWLRTTGRLLF
jgi:predicted metal-dependent hydrolase